MANYKLPLGNEEEEEDFITKLQQQKITRDTQTPYGNQVGG